MRSKKFIAKCCAMLSAAVLSFGIILPTAGCKDTSPKVESVQIEIMEAAFRPTAFVNEEFDILDVIANYDESLTYEIKELYYLDKDFKRQDIPFSGTKFTLTAAREVFVTLIAKNGDVQVGEEEFTLDYDIRSSELAEAYLTTWVDPGVTKTIVADAEYLTKDSTYGIKVDYNGAYNPVNDGVSIGAPDTKLGSNTSWENVVLTADIFNPQDYEIDVAIMFSKDNQMWTSGDFKTSRFLNPVTLTANGWTKAAWSFRSLGITEDVFESGVKLNMKVCIKDLAAAKVVAPYSYSIIFNNFDYVDYSAEKFPDLDTRTSTEIFAQEPGDLVDKLLLPNIMTTSNDASYGDVNAKTKVAPSIKEYGKEGTLATKPADLTTTSYIEYAVTQNGAMGSGNYFGFAFVYREAGNSYPATDDLKAQFADVTNWSKAKLGFWVYNDTDYTFVMKLASRNSVTADIKETVNVATKKGWEYVEFDLGKFNFTSNPFDSADATNYEFRIVFGFTGTGVTTMDANFAPKFYMDGFSIYNLAGDLEEPEEPEQPEQPEQPIDADAIDELLLANVEVDGTNQYQYAKAAVTATAKEYSSPLTAPATLTTKSYIEYAVTAKEGMASGNYYGYAFDFSNSGDGLKHNVSADLLAKFEATDWSSAKLGFWAYNDSDYTMTFTSSATVQWAQGKEVISIVQSKTWQYVEFDLSKFSYTSNPFNGSYCLKIIFGFTGTGVADTSFNAKFYVDGFGIYNRVENDTMDDLLIPQIMTQSNHSSYGDGNARTAITPSVKQYGATGALAAKPTGLTTNSYIEYSVTQSSNGPLASGNYFGYAFVYREKGSSYPGSEEFRGQFSGVTDWATAKLGFWVYNDTDYTFVLKSTAGHSVTADIKETITVETKKGWEYVEFDLSKFGYTSNPFASLDTTATGDELRIVFGFTSTGVNTTSSTFNPKFYIDGFSIYNA